MTESLKALSLWQPWGSLWVSPNKRHETRHWQTKHRGRLLVHAAKRLEIDVHEELIEILGREFGPLWARRLPIGAIIGMVDLVDVVPTEDLRVTDSYDAAAWRKDIVCGDFSCGRFGWRRGSYWRFPQPIPYRGRQMLFNVPREVVAAQIAAAVEVLGA